MKRFPEMDEGGLSKFKGFLVSRPNLAQVARRLGLGAHLRLGKTAEQGLARTKESLLADTLEAVIAAVFLDGGDQPARNLVNRLFGGHFPIAWSLGIIVGVIGVSIALSLLFPKASEESSKP